MNYCKQWFNDACKQAIKERKKSSTEFFLETLLQTTYLRLSRSKSQSEIFNKNSKENLLAKFLFFTNIKNQT